MKKILFYMYNLGGGGAERTIVNIINNLDKEKYEVVLVISSNQNTDYLDLINNNTKIINLNVERHRYVIRKLSKVIRDEKPDLLFSTLNMNNIILMLARLLSFKRIPTIIRVANNMTLSGENSLLNKIAVYIFYNFFANKVVALSKGVKDDLISNFKVNKDKIKVIYNPVDLNLINKLKNKPIVSEKIFLEENKKLIIAVGRLAKIKDYPTLLRAFKKVVTKNNVKLLILGKGPEENKLKNMCKEMGIENKVIFLGFKDNPYKYMSIADVFVLSSKSEGFAHVVVEAMAIGIPVISSNCNSGPPEIIGNNRYGILFPVGDHDQLAKELDELLNDQSKANNYVKKGYQRANFFDAHAIVQEYENLFSTSIKNRK